MKNVLIYFMAFIYLNMALVPRLGEVDIYISGTIQQTDDINSFYELINVLLGYDVTADDEDSDTGTEDNATSVNIVLLYIPYTFCNSFQFSPNFSYNNRKKELIAHEDFSISSIYFGLDSPPPEV